MMTKTASKLALLMEDPSLSSAARLVINEAYQVLSRPGFEREPPHCSSCACGLPAEPSADAEDAERYRWLRHGDNDELVLRKTSYRDFFLLRNEKLDAAIDEHRAAERTT